jgi:hypothetical protein
LSWRPKNDFNENARGDEGNHKDEQQKQQIYIKGNGEPLYYSFTALYGGRA